MTAAILVVEHEPRYSERMKEALKARPVDLHFAKDGDEALQVFDQKHPLLVILSSVIPRISTADLIRQIKARPAGANTPILITVSGYTGKNPRGDAMRLGADDIAPKPFQDLEFAEKVTQLIALHSGPKLTSNQIFGDLLEDKHQAKPRRRTTEEDVNKLLDQTLTGLKIPNFARKKAEAEAAAGAPKHKTASGLDRRVEDTLSGLEKSVRQKTSPGTPMPARPEKVHLASPVVAPEPAPVREYAEEEGGNRFGQYTLVERIARGGMAEVWKATMRGAEGFEKVVAIKKILPHLSEDSDFVNMFIAEAKLAAQLNHNNIIHIYDLAKVASSYYIAMEYVEGHDLKDILKRSEDRGQTIPVELAMFIASKVAAALDYAHRKRDPEQKELGIVHRDVSPQNVLISNEGDIKLCDFGIAKAASKVTHTQAGALKGKLHYMSPEQAWGKPIDRRSDVFSLATVLFEMLTGRRLFSGENEISVLEQVREARIKAPSTINEEIPAEIDRIVLKALQREPEARTQTAGEMARDIDTVLYSFRPTPTSADLAIYLDRIYTHQTPEFARAEPEPVAPPPPPPPPAELPRHVAAAAPAAALITPSRHTDPRMFGAVAPVSGRKRLLPWIAAGLLVAVVAGGAIYVMVSRESAPPPAKIAVAATSPDGAASGMLVPFEQPVSQTAPAEEFVPVTDTSADQALIDEEVRRRVAAERARMDQQRSQQIAAQERAAAQERERQLALLREREAAAARTDTVAPPSRNEEPPPIPVAETATLTAAPEPQIQPAVVQETAIPVTPSREGDLVEAGTPGLVEPELISMKKVAYPPLAKLQKVSGVVILNVLVNEAGRVVDAKVIRGVSRNVGLNEAALEMVRGSTFRPGTKDGVRVKSYKTIVVPFKL